MGVSEMHLNDGCTVAYVNHESSWVLLQQDRLMFSFHNISKYIFLLYASQSSSFC